MANLVITIDGPAASGKSTAARLLAKELKATFLDTGAMYRAVTLAAMQSGIDMTDEDKLFDILDTTEFKFSAADDKMVVCINGKDVTEQIRSPEITANSKYIASVPKVRDRLVEMQRQFAVRQKKMVTEGRDQGTVAFPDADIKFFLVADPSERAKRRQAELSDKGIEENLEQLQNAIEQRDENDQARTVGPLKPANDAIVVDTTDFSIEQTLEKLLSCIEENV